MEPLDGIAEADALLGRPFPLPTTPVPLARWVEVRRTGDGAEVEWNLDDTRPQAPGRLALYAGTVPPDAQALGPGVERTTTTHGWTVVRAPLEEAQPSLKPVVEVTWRAGDLHLRLTAQGPWDLKEVLRLVRSVG